MPKDWADPEFQMDFWSQTSTARAENFEVNVQNITTEGIQQVLNIANDFFLPWVKEIINKDTSKNDMRLFSVMISVTFSAISHF